MAIFCCQGRHSAPGHSAPCPPPHWLCYCWQETALWVFHWGLRDPPFGNKINQFPLSDTVLVFLTRVGPPNWGLTQKMWKKITISHQVWQWLAFKLCQKALFHAWNPKNGLIFCLGQFWLPWKYFYQSPPHPHLVSSPMRLKTFSHPHPPHQKFREKNWYYLYNWNGYFHVYSPINVNLNLKTNK